MCLVLGAAALADGPGFENATSVCGVTPSYSDFVDLYFAYPIWTVVYKGGGAVGDFNNDGWQDIFVVAGPNIDFIADQLYLNNGDGTFTNVAAQAGVAVAHYGAGASVGDFNNDGWLDIYVTSWGPLDGNPKPGMHKLYRNNGDGTFTDVAAAAGVHWTGPNPDGFGSAFGDYDLDGHLDLAVAAWNLNSGGNRLFRNNGDGTFTNVTTTALNYDMTPLQAYSPSFVDMDGDRYPELLWVTDFGKTKYFINNADGTFTEATAAAGVGFESNGMGSVTCDVDGDGLLDWYVTSINTLSGNMLYLNQGGHVYHEVSEPAGVNNGGWGWGTTGIDIDHDGLVDLVATNGWIQTPWDFDLTRVFRNLGDGTFLETATAIGFIDNGQGRGLVNVDIDNDGDQDVVIFGMDYDVQVFRNKLSGPDTNWLRVFLDTSAAPGLAPNGFGTRVSATAAGKTQLRYVDGGCRFQSVAELSAHFGLAAATTVDQLKVEWANGAVTTIAGVQASRTIVVRALPADLNGDCSVDQSDLGVLLADYGCPTLHAPPCAGDIDGDGETGQSDLGTLLGVYGQSCLATAP